MNATRSSQQPTENANSTIHGKDERWYRNSKKAGKVESLNDDERKALEPESTTQPYDSKDGCKFKSAIDEGTASADGSSADAGVQAERYQGITTGTAIQFPNGVDSSEKMIVFLMIQNEL